MSRLAIRIALISTNLKSTLFAMEHEQKEVLITWLEAGDAADYQAGVLLLQAHCGNRGLVNMLLKKESAGNREKLRYELIKVGCEGRMEDVSEVLNHFAQAVQGAAAPVVQLVSEAEQPAPEAVPEAVRADVDDLTQLMQKLYNMRCQLSNSLADLEPAQAPEVVAEILNLQNQYNALASKRRSLVAGGPVAEAEQPAAEAAPVVDRAELTQKRQNLRSNLSKARKKLDEAKTEAKKSELEQKIGVLNVELANIEVELALPQA